MNFFPVAPVYFSVDYDDSGRPANLANSAVLKYLEEQEEEKRNAGKWCLHSGESHNTNKQISEEKYNYIACINMELFNKIRIFVILSWG